MVLRLLRIGSLSDNLFAYYFPWLSALYSFDREFWYVHSQFLVCRQWNFGLTCSLRLSAVSEALWSCTACFINGSKQDGMGFLRQDISFCWTGIGWKIVFDSHSTIRRDASGRQRIRISPSIPVIAHGNIMNPCTESDNLYEGLLMCFYALAWNPIHLFIWWNESIILLLFS